MKVTIDLSQDDLDFLDEYTRKHGHESRSHAVHRAVDLLRASELGPAYEAAWDEWERSGDAEVWSATAGDGLEP